MVTSALRQSSMSNTASLPRTGPNVTLDQTAGAVTWTATMVLGGLIRRLPEGGQSDVTPTFALLIAELKRRGLPIDPGTCMDVLVTNEDDADALTITAGANSTLIPATMTIAAGKAMILRFIITSATAYTVFSVPGVA